MTLQWVSADLATGRLIADLPSFDGDWPLKRTVSTTEDGSGVLHLDGAPENWERAVEEANSILVCYDDAVADDGTQPMPIMWAGVAWSSTRDASSDDVPVSMSTFESVLDSAFVGDVTYTTSDHRDDIIADLVNDWVIGNMGITCLVLDYTAGGGPTPPLMDSPPNSIPTAAIIMQNTDNASVKARMDQVFAQLGGEYTVEWAWSADGESVIPSLRFGDRIGTAVPAGLEPAVTFELPGSLTAFVQTRDYSPGKGANKVVPYSTGQGSSTPFGTPVTAPADGRPVFEYRYQPASNLSPASLSKYAQQAIKVLAPGARPVSLTAALSACAKGRQLGVDWRLGDDIGYEVGVTRPVLAFPGGVTGVGRSIGYQLTDTTITPILADSTLYTEA